MLVCCGGLAAPKLGAVNAYGLLTALGCKLAAPLRRWLPLKPKKRRCVG